MPKFFIPKIVEATDEVPAEQRKPAVDILRQTMELESMLYLLSSEDPSLVKVLYTTRPLLQAIMDLRFITCAVQESPRRSLTGKKGATGILGKERQRSAVYHSILDLGLSVEDLRVKSLDTLAYESPVIRALILGMQREHAKLTAQYGTPPTSPDIDAEWQPIIDAAAQK